jgi:hypothetical protein
MGSIMMGVAVFDTHILRAAVTTMKPATTLVGLDPNRRRTEKANRLCKPQRCIERARINPPMKRKINS